MFPLVLQSRSPSFVTVYCFICDHLTVAVARYRIYIICLVLVPPLITSTEATGPAEKTKRQSLIDKPEYSLPVLVPYITSTDATGPAEKKKVSHD